MYKRGTVFLAVILSLFLVGCGPSIKTVRTVWYEVDPSTPSPQNKHDVTISVEPISMKNYKNYKELAVPRALLPEYVIEPGHETKTMIRGSYDASRMAKDGVIWWIPTGGGTTGFYARIKNNSDHILRMKDARIYYIVKGEPYPAIVRAEYGQNDHRVLYREISKVCARQMKFINDVRTEILPGFEYGGYLVFAIDPENAVEGELKFFDITIKVDKTGAPLEKTAFSFKLIRKEETKKYKVSFTSVEEIK